MQQMSSLQLSQIRGDEIGNTEIIADINKMNDDDGNPIYPFITNDSIDTTKVMPDLIVSNVLINPECTNVHEIFANESNIVDATICNIGGDDAGAFGVRFSIAGIPFATKPVSGLNAGECVNTMPSISAGDYNLTVKTDFRNDVKK